MIWSRAGKCCISSVEGYMVSKYAMERSSMYIARGPGGKILHSGADLDKAKAACVAHLKGVAA